MTVGPDPLGPVVITAREIYDQLVRLTTAVNDLIKDVRGAEGDLVDIEKRLRAVEARQWPLPVLTLIISAVGVGVAILIAVTR